MHKEGDEWKTTSTHTPGVIQISHHTVWALRAPGVFMNLINKELLEYLYKGVFMYLDNVLIYFMDYKSHVHFV